MLRKWRTLLGQAERLERSITLECVCSSFLGCAEPYVPLVGMALVIEALTAMEMGEALVAFLVMAVAKAAISLAASLLNSRIEQKKQMLYTDFGISTRDIFLGLDYATAQSGKVREMMRTVDYNNEMYGGLTEVVSLSQGMLRNALTIGVAAAAIVSLVARRPLRGGGIALAGSFAWAALVVAGCLGAFFLVRRASRRFSEEEESLYAGHRETERTLDYYMSHFYGDADTIRTIQQNDMRALISRKVGEKVRRSVHLFDRIRGLRLKEVLCHSCVNYLICAALYALLAYKTYCGAVSVGAFSFYYGAIVSVSAAIAAMIDDSAQLRVFLARLDEYLELLEYAGQAPGEGFAEGEAASRLAREQDAGEQDAGEQRSGEGSAEGEAAGQLAREDLISIRGLCYQYENSDCPVLKDISLTFGSREKVAIVGPNGAGKSTLVNCICGLLPATEGEIRICGANVNEMSAGQKKEFFGTVFQDYAYFPFTLGENVSLSEEYDRELAIRAINSQNWEGGKIADERTIGEEVGLSGGQKQKVAVARARFREHMCYILDEPSASMDIFSEQRLYEEYERITSERLCILISHRMASCIHSDRIIVMDHGSVIDMGRHEELLERCGLYRTMWDKQAEHYVTA